MYRRLIYFALGLATVPLLVGGALPWLAERGYAGRVIQINYREGRDATPLFYTESEEVMRMLEKTRDE
jgi:hypothetical protein